MNPPSMSFSSVFPPLKMTQTVLKKFPWRNVLPRSALPQTFSIEVSRPVHPNVDVPGGFFHMSVSENIP